MKFFNYYAEMLFNLLPEVGCLKWAALSGLLEWAA